MKRSQAHALLGLTSIACDPQVDAGYQGEPVATISGTVIDERSRSLDAEVEVGLMWQGKRADDYGISGDVVTISTTFPSAYHLAIHAPPPPEARRVGADFWLNLCEDEALCVQYPDEIEAQLRNEFDAVSVASLYVAERGAFAALGEVYWSPEDARDTDADEDAVQRAEAFSRSLVGGAEGVILYVDRDFSADSYVGRAVGQAVAAGYYFMPWTVPTEAMLDAAEACIDGAGGDVLVELECNLVAFAESRTLEGLEGVDLRLVDDLQELYPDELGD